MCTANDLYNASLLPHTVTTSTLLRTTSLTKSQTSELPTTGKAIATETAKGLNLLDIDPNLIYALIGGFVGLCVLVGIGKYVFKHPKMHSKYGRKNSYGTLNTMNTVATGKLK